jgi:ubiquinol-cytochrome c reductase cytochrome b subunit
MALRLRRFRTSDWLDVRTGYRDGLRRLLDEPIPGDVNWWFTLGSVLLFLLLLQFTTGAVLTMYYVPTPTHAYDSVRFITSALAFGRVLRGLHFFGASFIVVFAVLHLLRVLFFGAYKAPREVTWMSGIVLLLLVLAFGLTGCLLPWDQRAYWATVVTVNIARSTPIVGEYVAAVMRGGPAIGALTLSRWYSTHVILLPAGLVLFVAIHIHLMRRHGIAGHFNPRPLPASPFYPFHAVKDTIVIAAVFAALLSLAVFTRPPLGAMADPSDASFVPRPEWYFLGLFQLLKYFPGRLEPVGAIGIPTLIIVLLFFLPFLDPEPDRNPRARPRLSAVVAVTVVSVGTLTWLGFRDTPPEKAEAIWGARAIAGRDLAAGEQCARCHTAGGPGPDLARGRVNRDDGWIQEHVSDPEMIAAGLRPPPAGGLNPAGIRAVLAYVKKLRAATPQPRVSDEDRRALDVIGTTCITCHTLDGDGGREGPDLTHAAGKPDHDAAWLETWIADPGDINPDADMPAFRDRLSPSQLKAVAAYLSRRK